MGSLRQFANMIDSIHESRAQGWSDLEALAPFAIDETADVEAVSMTLPEIPALAVEPTPPDRPFISDL